MGLTDLLSDLYDSLTWTDTHAEAEAEDKEDDSAQDDSGEEKKDDDSGDGEDGEKEDGGDEGGDEKEEDGGDDEDEEDEEEEDEPVDPKPKLEEECANSAQCSAVKHHFDSCVERVTQQQESDEENKGPHEDCVEEFFHLQHCATQCAAPKLWRALK